MQISALSFIFFTLAGMQYMVAVARTRGTLWCYVTVFLILSKVTDVSEPIFKLRAWLLSVAIYISSDMYIDSIIIREMVK